MTGTILNVVAVLLGTTIGVLLGQRFPERMRGIAMQAIGLVTLVLGVQMALQTQNLLIVLASVVVGGLLGEGLNVEGRLEMLGRWFEARSTGALSSGGPQARSSTFVQGFVTSSLVFCVGPVTILGSIQDGLTGDYRLLAVKSLFDGFASIAFASALGVGVYFSALVVLVYQGGLRLLARILATGIPDPSRNAAIIEMTAAGGILVLGIGLRLLDIKQIRVGNLLPALGLAPLLTVLVGRNLSQLTGTS